MRLLRRPTLVLNAALVALALAGTGWAYQAVTASDTGQASTGQRERVIAASQGSVTLTVSASGTVQSATTASANFVTSGTVTEIDAKVGDVVTKGQLLAKVDPSSAQDDLETAQANLTAAKQALTRAKNNNSDDATIASAQAEVTQAETDVATAQRAVDGCVLTAPISGTVTAVNGAVGSSSGSSGGSSGGSTGGSSTSSSSSSSGFIQLADLTSLQVASSFAETDATKLKVGQAATVTWSALSGTTAKGKVVSIAPTATTSNNVNTYAVVTSIESAPTGARLGQSTTVAVTVAEATNAVRVPTGAVRTAGGQSTVQVRSGDKTETRTVQVGVQGNTYVEIKSGLTAGEQVVITIQVTASSSARSGSNQQGNLFGGGGNAGVPPAGPGGGR